MKSSQKMNWTADDDMPAARVSEYNAVARSYVTNEITKGNMLAPFCKNVVIT